MSSSAGVEDFLDESRAFSLLGLDVSREEFNVNAEPESVAQRIVGRSRDRTCPTREILSRKG
jgi:hypothetical protein